MQRLRAMALTAALTLAAGAVVKELRKPREDRMWHGRIVGLPYDFRAPTLERARRAWWDPEGAVVTSQPLGVGWTLNLGRLARISRRT